MKVRLRTIFILFFLLISACVSGGLGSKILFDDNMPDFNCIKETIKKIDGVKLIGERVIDDFGVCIGGDCTKKIFSADYSVDGLEHYPASVTIKKTRSDRMSINNSLRDRFGTLNEDQKKIGQSALDHVSKNIHRVARADKYAQTFDHFS